MTHFLSNRRIVPTRRTASWIAVLFDKGESLAIVFHGCGVLYGMSNSVRKEASLGSVSSDSDDVKSRALRCVH